MEKKELICSAIKQLRQISFLYKGDEDSSFEKRIVEPHALYKNKNYKEIFVCNFVSGHSTSIEKGEATDIIRDYKLRQIKDVVILSEGFDIDNRLKPKREKVLRTICSVWI